MLPPIWDISRLKHPFYALVYAAKGPFVLGALWREKECIKFGIQKCKIYVPGVQDE